MKATDLLVKEITGAVRAHTCSVHAGMCPKRNVCTRVGAVQAALQGEAKVRNRLPRWREACAGPPGPRNARPGRGSHGEPHGASPWPLLGQDSHTRHLRGAAAGSRRLAPLLRLSLESRMPR